MGKHLLKQFLFVLILAIFTITLANIANANTCSSHGIILCGNSVSCDTVMGDNTYSSWQGYCAGYCVKTSCGDGTVQKPNDYGVTESCEYPNTVNNGNCPQTASGGCDGYTSLLRDASGNCNSGCGCTYDSFVPTCDVHGSCGAVCDASNPCWQQLSKCNGVLNQTRDDRGICNGDCSCTFDSWPAGQCIKGTCGATCSVDADCDTLNNYHCDGLSCSCRQGPYCGNGNKDPGETCELPNTASNNNCPVTGPTSQCGTSTNLYKLGIKSAFDYCGAGCTCDSSLNPFVYSCSISCGAQWDSTHSCTQTTSQCNGKKLDTRPSNGATPNSDCTCTGGSWTAGSCSKSCGALNTSDAECISAHGPGWSLDASSCTCIQGTHCGDNIVQTPNAAGVNEQCDVANTCWQQLSQCNGVFNQSRDAIGAGCNGDCTCNYDPWPAGQCVKGTCGATCSVDGDCTAAHGAGWHCDTSSCSCIQGAYCGDNTIQTPNALGLNEQCDPSTTCNPVYGNPVPYCNACKNDVCSGGTCGDGVKQVGHEQCDNGTGNTDTACSAPYGGSCSYCTTGCLSQTVDGPYCGDGTIQSGNGEECDDGANNGPDKACTSSCKINCLINSVSITPGAGCLGNVCGQGDSLSVSVSYSLDCSKANFVQIDYRSLDSTCTIQGNGINMAGINSLAALGGNGGTATFSYTIPVIPPTCAGQNMALISAALKSGSYNGAQISNLYSGASAGQIILDECDLHSGVYAPYDLVRNPSGPPDVFVQQMRPYTTTCSKYKEYPITSDFMNKKITVRNNAIVSANVQYFCGVTDGLCPDDFTYIGFCAGTDSDCGAQAYINCTDVVKVDGAKYTDMCTGLQLPNGETSFDKIHTQCDGGCGYITTGATVGCLQTSSVYPYSYGTAACEPFETGTGKTAYVLCPSGYQVISTTGAIVCKPNPGDCDQGFTGQLTNGCNDVIHRGSDGKWAINYNCLHKNGEKYSTFCNLGSKWTNYEVYYPSSITVK